MDDIFKFLAAIGGLLLWIFGLIWAAAWWLNLVQTKEIAIVFISLAIALMIVSLAYFMGRRKRF